MNSAKYIEIFKNGQKEGIRDVTVKRKLQTVRKFLSYLEDAQTDDLLNIDRKNVEMWHKNKNKERKKMNKLEGKLVADGAKIGIVAARFNEFIVSKLVGGAMDGLIRHDVKEEDVTVAWVPGAFEIPVVAKKMAKSGKYDAVICLGAVIRGATSHYDYVCNEVSKGVASVSLETEIPVLFGVVTTENIEQAIERAGTKAGNKGYDCALSAIEMINLMKQI